jgi:hypothetical protein
MESKIMKMSSSEEALVSSSRMQRRVHIVVALLAVFLLVRPFDCFVVGKFDQKAADCCKKGNCSPGATLQLWAIALFVQIHQPSGSTPDLSLNLPLLI